MTWIVDGSGRHWVEVPQRKRRGSPKAVRFAHVKVGDQIMLRPKKDWHRNLSMYFVVTDLWFDPVVGQRDPIKGQMVGYQQIGPDGLPRGSKDSTTIRGLASQQFQYADIDYIELCKSRAEEMLGGKVVGIGAGVTIRKRPKMAGSPL